MTCYKCVKRAIEKSDSNSYCILKNIKIKPDRIACEFYDNQSNYLPGGKQELTEGARKAIKQKYDEVYNS